MARREPTEEQKAAAAERRARFRALCRQLAGMGEEERERLAERLPGVVTVEGRRLSTVNTLLLAHQREAVTVVGGFRQWRRAGRCVRRGERGLSLWIPRLPRQGDEDGPEDEIRFLMGTVFDVSQTEEANGAEEAAEA